MNSRELDGPYPYKIFLNFAETLLQSAGLEQERAHVVADILLEVDLMGHSTHGVQFYGGDSKQPPHCRSCIPSG